MTHFINARLPARPPQVLTLPVHSVSDLWRRPPDDGLDVWAVSDTFLAPCQHELAAYLSAEERDRRDRLVRPEDRRRFELYHGAVRRILAAYLDADPAALAFERGSAGKPALAAPHACSELAFNLSHSGHLMALACGRRSRIGVDVEVPAARTDVAGVAARFFHPREHVLLASLPDAPRRELFHHWWTAKEAFLKTWGEGLSGELAGIDFSAWTDQPSMELLQGGRARALAWRFGRPGAWAGTLVVEPAADRIRWRPGADLAWPED